VVSFEVPVLRFPASGSGGVYQHPFTINPSDADRTASEDVTWISLFTTSGNGPGTLNFRVQAHGWRGADIGWLNDADFPSVYHADFGFALYANDFTAGSKGFYLYSTDTALGWIYVTPAIHPYVYSFSHDAWMYPATDGWKNMLGIDS